jgi:DNA invertase Pin-like site-specific DNA recombinase
MQPDRSEPSKRATTYARSSQLNSLGGTHSIQKQIGLCKAYCAKHGYFLLEDQMYSEVKGGTDEADHPELARLRKAAQQGLIDVLVIASRERLTRDARANALLIEPLKAKGRAIEIVEESQSEQQ